MTRKRVAIVTCAGDFHALVIQKAIEKNYHVVCSIIEANTLSGRSGLSWSSSEPATATLPTSTGEYVEVRALDCLWFRRFNFPARIAPDITNPAQVDLVTNDCREALFGLLLNEFQGVWVSDPDATREAGNKLKQLRVAELAGFRIPDTLVSQNPEEIRRFCHDRDNQVVVKAVKGTIQTAVLTTMVNETMLNSDEELRLCPAIFQEFIPGTQHLRVACFGDTIHAALIESEDLDWRSNLNVPVRAFYLCDKDKIRLRKVLTTLRLKMGIFDLKLGKDGEAIWLEINPQGQFLFVEALCGLKVIDAFSEFLYSQALQRPE